ncbi:uncharacterized protein LOC128235663 [Mya arenaria]|uniref:uncharacterized protein LOC128235663 n=1 Tax=Mya arenaria TaxID=6604 RepID=UPI0022E81E1E|nr:uncharacterized protein LOC128235663 [Mya arenaria]
MEKQEVKKRSPNFSLHDCMLLAEVMGGPSGTQNLTRYQYVHNKHTPSITTKTKRHMWEETIPKMYNAGSEFPRSSIDLLKKWDNLVQRHNNLYQDYIQNQQKTGGGPNAGTIGLLTDAVISVVGKKACGLIGISGQAGMPMDSGFLQLPSNNVSTGISTTNGSDLNSASTWGISASSNASLSASEDLVTNYSPVQMVTDLNVTSETYNISDSVICTCSCHTVMQGLREEKLRLQIRVLKKQLGEE